MDTEFHYWITGIIAREAGFDVDEAKAIAYSSEFVDENDVSLDVKDRSSTAVYTNFITQTLNILKPRAELLRIYPIYHFVPGNPQAPSARRRDGKMHLFNTTPDNKFANSLLQDAFHAEEDARLYRIGIATHAYADTWAHQNFTGWHESFNAIGLNPTPNIGHADAQHHPDWVGHRWDDSRILDSEVNNNHRFLSAAERIFRHYCYYLESTGRYAEQEQPDWKAVQDKLAKAMGPVSSGDENYGRKARISAYQELAPWLPDFDENTWLQAAVDVEVKGLRDSEDGLLSSFTVFKDSYYWRAAQEKEKTDWYRFQRAVKQHERFALRLLSPLFDQIGIDLKRA
ncbi:MAG: DUF6765 family protein [Thermodesulfobacteriota bacterium]